MATATKPRELPILFTGEMVRAIIEGGKNQTRRVVKGVPADATEVFAWFPPQDRVEGENYAPGGLWVRTPEGLFHMGASPYGQPGDLLYVRETWAAPASMEHVRPSAMPPAMTTGLWYRDPPAVRIPRMRDKGVRGRWRPSIHMPKWASRIWLEVTDVRVERVQEVSEADAMAEGISRAPFRPDDGFPVCDGYMVGKDDGETPLHTSAANAFRHLWDSINADRAPWDANPWVWVVSFRRIER